MTSNKTRSQFIEDIRNHSKQKQKSLDKDDQNARLEGKVLFEEGQEEAINDDKRYSRAITESVENKNKRYKKNTKLRAKYARKVLCFMYAYFSLVMAIIFLQGFSLWGFEIENVALTALIGSAFVSAVGLVGFVIQGLFPKRQDD